MSESQAIKRFTSIPAVPLIASWLIPGLGHLCIGQIKRGFILGLAIIFLYISGLLIGSVSVVSHSKQPLWYYIQVLAGPHTLVINSYNKKNFVNHPEYLDDPDIPYPVKPAISRPHEMGTLYCSLAGVLNLLIILDLIGRMTQPKPTPQHIQGQLITRDNPS